VTAARWRWRIGTVLVLAVVAVLVVRGSNRPDDPELAPPSTTTRQERPASDDEVGSPRPPLEGFDEVAFRISPEGAEASTWCALLADRVEERARGLMGQEDLLGYDAMAFRYDAPTTVTFTMRNTPLPLSIAFFDEDGAFVSARDMDPCPPGTADCPSYSSEGPYLHALEVEQGELPSLGIGPGSRLSFPDQPCPSA
jgi:uncharacterized membrane protein (UPF0127 family)